MNNTTRNTLMTALKNIDDVTYDTNIQAWANDAICSFGEYLLQIWNDRSMAENDCCRKIDEEMHDWFETPGVECSAEYCLKCLGIMSDNQYWAGYCDDENNSENNSDETVDNYELAEEILSWIIGDVTTKIVEWLKTQFDENDV